MPKKQDLHSKVNNQAESSVKNKKKIKTDEYGKKIVRKSASSLSTIIKAVVYIVVVLVISVISAYFVVTIANDVFALKKENITVEITLDNYETIDDLASKLKEEGIIQYPSIFKLYASLKEDDGEFLAGKYQVPTQMNYDSLLEFFKEQRASRVIVNLTIPEGYTVDEIIELFLSKDMGTRDGFVDAIQNADFSDYRFIQELEKNKPKDGRKYRLEGYLFPDTYEFYQDWSEERILRTLLDNFDKKFIDVYYKEAEKQKMTVDEYITLASIIQSEAKYSTDLELVSRVFHNRLNNASKFPKLESDATIQYTFDTHKTTVTPEDLKIDSPYNTYLYNGLPPSAICNPGMDAIYAAFQPSTSSESKNYFYFVSRANGEILYARTKAEHEKNIAEIEETEN